VNDDPVAAIEQTAVVGADAVADFASGVDEWLPSESKRHVRLIEKCVPVQDDFESLWLSLCTFGGFNFLQQVTKFIKNSA
jgi:hypothetical protein